MKERLQASIDCANNSDSHVRHVSDSHVRHVTDSHVRHVRGRFVAANESELSPQMKSVCLYSQRNLAGAGLARLVWGLIPRLKL